MRQPLAEQFWTLADRNGSSRNLVSETYNNLLHDQRVQGKASDSFPDAEPNQQQTEIPNSSDDLDNQDNKTSDPIVESKPFFVLSKRRFTKLLLMGLVLFIVIPFVVLLVLDNIPIDNSEVLKPIWDDYVNGILTAIYTDDQKLSAADKLYSWADQVTDLDCRNRYYIDSAILKEGALDRRFPSEKDDRIATQGLNICQSVLESAPEESFQNIMARILRCLFFEVLNDTADETTWSQDASIIEDYLGSCSLDVRNNEDALLSNYGYRALMDYYEKMLQTNYHLGTEEIYKKYIEYYNKRCNNRFLVAFSSGSDMPSFDLNEFAAYSEIVFRLVKMDPSSDYATYLSAIIDQCDANRGSIMYMDRSTYESMKLTSIMADAYYHWSLIAENEVNDYDLDQVENLKAKAKYFFSSLLELKSIDQWEKLDIVVKSILKSSQYDFSSPSDSEAIKHFGDVVLELPEWGFAPSSDAINELKTAVCISCYNIRKNNYISDDLIDLGKRAAEFLEPIDTYDLVVTEEDIPVIKEYLETCETEAELMGQAG